MIVMCILSHTHKRLYFSADNFLVFCCNTVSCDADVNEVPRKSALVTNFPG